MQSEISQTKTKPAWYQLYVDCIKKKKKKKSDAEEDGPARGEGWGNWLVAFNSLSAPELLPRALSFPLLLSKLAPQCENCGPLPCGPTSQERRAQAQAHQELQCTSPSMGLGFLVHKTRLLHGDLLNVPSGRYARIL